MTDQMDDYLKSKEHLTAKPPVPPQTNNQDEVIKFVSDPKNIAKAVEGSMDKRNALHASIDGNTGELYDFSDQTMANKLDVEIDEIVEEYVGILQNKSTKQMRAEAKAKINRLLVEAEIAGLDKAKVVVVVNAHDVQDMVTNIEKEIVQLQATIKQEESDE